MQCETQGEFTSTTVEIPREPGFGLFCMDIGEPNRHRSVGVAEGCSLRIGSSCECDVALRDKTVSSQHCVVECSEGRLWVQDTGSRNGVYVGGARVHRAELQVGTSFVIGQVAISVRTADWDRGINPSVEPLPRTIGQSPAMMRIADRVRRLAPLSVPVLVRGETGTGKDLVARALHELGPRASKPFIALNAGSLAKDIASAELFGHDRGAFTGAHIRREGAFAAANGGTLFLDEVGELPADVQVKLLRALEEGEVRPLGSVASVKVNVRIVAATWAPLERLVEQGRFREDLYHRLAVGLVGLPPLSERRSDISALVEHFLSQCDPEIGRKRISSAALGCLIDQRWPGNIRQLRNVVFRSALLARTGIIGTADVEAAIHEQPLMPSRMSRPAALALVRSCDGKVAKAAKLCGVPRSTFRGWLRSQQEHR